MRSPLEYAATSIAGVCLVVTFVGSTATLGAQGGKKKPAGEKELTWGPAPAIFPAGAKMAVERGDPTKAGEFIVRLSFPDGYKIPPHFHPTAEHVRVRGGTLLVGMGDKLDVAATKPLAVGDTGTIAAKMHHFAVARGNTIVSIRADGPFSMTYVNPADTPSKP